MSTKADPYSKEDELDTDAFTWSRTDEIKETIHTIISHHPPSLYSHCHRVSFLGRSVYFCSRCSGIYSGMGIGLIAVLILGLDLSQKWFWFLVALMLGFATVVDWMTQRIAPRKTKNSYRFITGVMAGLGLSIVFMLADLLYMLLTLGLMVGSVALVSMLERRLKKVSHAYPMDMDFIGEEDTESEE
ncbi:MAG: DUF2085 domain-containing protein [Candidatus Thorarchaeota archaeon]|jgi:uncharacterized membrane protein